MIPDPFNPNRVGADALIAGFYLIRRQGRTDIPVRVWYGAPVEDGVELDRSLRWQVQVGFDSLDDDEIRIGGIAITSLSDIWPACAREPIDETEWRFRLERAEWTAQYDPWDAHSEIGGRIDPLTCTLP